MDFEEFKEQVKLKVSMKLGVETFLEEVPKNNGISLTGLIIRGESTNISTIVYLNDYFENYQNGIGIGDIMDSIFHVIHSNEFSRSVDLSGFLEYAKARKQIVFRLVNYGKNKERLAEIPHRRFLDLAVVYYYLVLEKPFDGKAAVQINNRHMEGWGISEDELYKTALYNTPALLPCDIKNMDTHMINMIEKGIAGDYGEDDEMKKLCLQYILSEIKSNSSNKIPMYVMTNKDILMGAVCMLYPGIVKKFSCRVDSDLYILPSSVHETIIVPAGENINPEELKRIVPEINIMQVDAEEQLSDNIYVYRRATDTIAIA